MPEQVLRLYDGDVLVAAYPVSTSRFGIGTREGSHCTPPGRHVIGEMIGHGAEPGTIFRSREPVGRWDAADPAAEPGDLVLTRILWLEGAEDGNANSRERYIYIHGTNHEGLIGRPASIGCVRMRNADVVDLFNRVEPGVEVMIIA